MQFLLPVNIVRADTGPKPTIEFEFNQDLLAEPVTMVSGILYKCQQPDCSDSRPLEELGPQGFNCSTDSCSAMFYGFASDLRIEESLSHQKEHLMAV